MNQLADPLMQFLGLHSPVLRSRHQEKLKKTNSRSRQGSKHRQLKKEQQLKEGCRDRKFEVATSKTTSAIYSSIR